MRSLNIGIYLLLIAILFCVEVANSDNSVNPKLRTKREIVSGNETISDNVEIDDVNVIYVCNGENSDEKCTCINETLNCNQGSLAYYNNNVLQHSNIQIRNKNFTVKIVNFQYNKFTFLKKNEILSWHESKVEELYFYYNDIATIENGTFDKFLSLKKLGFEYNSLKSINETILTKQLGSTLKELNFYGNNIQNLSTNTFKYCTELTLLNFQRNKKINLVEKINGINVTVFPGALENLKYLNLASCNLKEFDENVFINLRSLQKLILSDNLFISVPKAIKMLPTLQHLDIRFSLIRSINDCDFCNLSNLRTLFLSDSYALTYINENAFGALNNHSTTFPPSKLNDISLHNCNISILPEKLLDWKNITSIDISNNPLSCNCSMAWLINDINATSPLYANNLKNYLGISYKNKLVCHYPNVLYGTHLYKISGDFCSNGTFVVEDIVKKRDEIYYACEDGGFEKSRLPCTCRSNIFDCEWYWWIYKSKLNHTNIGIQKNKFTIESARFSGNNNTSLKKDKVLPGHEHTVKNLRFASNKITYIENGTFDKFIALEELNLSYNNLTIIDDVIFPSSLKRLELRYNFLEHLPTKSFQNSFNLTLLDLSGNRNILSTTNYIFPFALKNLITLSLPFCNISHLDVNIFINLRSLETLSLASNPLTTIPLALNALSQSLHSLNLYQINITVLQNTGLNNFYKLTYITLTSSNLERIEDCAFCKFPNLKYVSILYSLKLSYIHENAFGGLTNETPLQLEYLDIKNCNISTFSEKLLNWKNITSIDIRNNPLSCNCSMAWLINDYNASTPLYVNNLQWFWLGKYKNDLTCYNPPELRYEYLYKLSGDFCLNETVEEEEIVLQVCSESDEENDSICSCENENLKCNSLENTNIEISENRTVEIKSIQIIHGNISHLNLKKLLPSRQSSIENLHFYQTNIKSIENGTFDNFTSLKALDLSENLLTLINETILTKQIGSTLIELDLNSNRLTLLSPNAFTYLTKLKVLNLNNNLLINLSSNIFSKSLASLEHLDISDCNISNLMDDVFVNLSNLTHLHLSGNPLTTFPTAINFLPKLQFLEISSTKITVLKNSGTRLNKNLKYLHGYSTKIERIENCAFCNFPNLKEVNFDFSNALSFIDENAFGFAHSHLKPSLEKFSIYKCNFTTLPENLLNWNSLKHFDAAGNPFNCNCSMNWLIKFIKEKSDPTKNSFYQCSNPSQFKGKTFLELPETFCNETLENSITLIPSTSTTVLPVTVTEVATSQLNGHLMLVILMISLFIGIAFALIVGGCCYYQKRKIIQIPRNGEDDEDLIEEDFDTENV